MKLRPQVFKLGQFWTYFQGFVDLYIGVWQYFFIHRGLPLVKESVHWGVNLDIQIEKPYFRTILFGFKTWFWHIFYSMFTLMLVVHFIHFGGQIKKPYFKLYYLVLKRDFDVYFFFHIYFNVSSSLIIKCLSTLFAIK